MRLAAALLLLPLVAFAEVPDKLGYSGRLLKSDGSPTTGTQQFTFSVFDAATGGAALWSEDQTLLLTGDGLYATQLGAVTAIPASVWTGTGGRWLELKVAGTALLPRQAIGAVAFAQQAKNLAGGVVDATSIKINGTEVISSTGKVSGAALTLTAGNGLAVDGSGNLAVKACAVEGQVLQWNASSAAWVCAALPAMPGAGPGLLSDGGIFAVDFGSGAGKVCAGNDPRLTDARAPAGSASGDLSGTYPAPAVAGLQGRPLSSAAPAADQVLAWSGMAWQPTTLTGLPPSSAPISCKALHQTNASAPTGQYYLDPDGTGPRPPFLAYCDMTTAGGGWTHIATLSNADGVRGWSQTSPPFAPWLDSTSLAGPVVDLTNDYKSRAFFEVAATELQLTTDKGVSATYSGLNNKSLRDRIKDEIATCAPVTTTTAVLTVTSSSVASMNRNLLINTVDNNYPNHCTLAAADGSASDSAVLAFANSIDAPGVSTGAGLLGLGQSWEWNIKDTRLPVVQCGPPNFSTTASAIDDCFEDFASGYSWEQGGAPATFRATPLNNNTLALEPDRVLLWVR